MAGSGWRTVAWAAALTGLLAGADAAAGEPEEVRVCVIAIIATQRDNKVDKCLERIAREVRKKHPELTGFHLASGERGMSCQSVAVGTDKTFTLPENESARITVKSACDKKNRVILRVKPPRMDAITYETPCGKFLPIETPVKTKAKDLLYIAVRVTPCGCD
jgi:hypothetical protein